MGVLDGLGEGSDKCGRRWIGDRLGALLEPVSQADPRAVSHRDEADRPDLADFVDRYQVRMIEPGRCAGFVTEACAGLAVRQSLRSWDLQRHLAAQLGIVGQVDNAEGAPAQLPADFEATQPLESGGAPDRPSLILVEGFPLLL